MARYLREERRLGQDLAPDSRLGFLPDSLGHASPFSFSYGAACRDHLAGTVEVDETFLGGARPGKRGRGATGKALVAVAVEILKPKGFGRCRLRIIPNAQGTSLRAFLIEGIEPGSILVTEGLLSYLSAVAGDYVHEPVSIAQSGEPAHVALPGVHP